MTTPSPHLASGGSGSGGSHRGVVGSNATKPTVLLIDLDGTMIGRIGCMLCEYDLHRQLRTVAAAAGGGGGQGPSSSSPPSSSAAAAASGVPKAVKDAMVARMRYGIVRPYLDQFCALAKATPGVELFVYTASDPEWAAFAVPCVEQAIGARFNRPILARNHCRPAPDYSKSISHVAPLVLRALRPRYPALRSVADLDGCIALVDNTLTRTRPRRGSSRAAPTRTDTRTTCCAT